MNLFKLSFLLLLVSCRATSYKISEVTNQRTVEIGIKQGTFNVAHLSATPVYNQDSTVDLSEQDGVLVVHTREKILSTQSTTTSIFANKAIQKKELRNQKDSVDRGDKMKVSMARIELRKSKPGFLEQIKWIVFGLAALAAGIIVLKFTKWRHSTK